MAALDIVFIVALALFVILGIWRGFVVNICKLAGTILSIVLSVTFCTPAVSLIDRLFGLTDLMAQSMNPTLAKYLAIAISFIALLVLIKLATWLIGKLLKSLVDLNAAIKAIDKVLGAVFGVCIAFVLLTLALIICRMINLDQIDQYIASTTIVNWVYTSKWFLRATEVLRNVEQAIAFLI